MTDKYVVRVFENFDPIRDEQDRNPLACKIICIEGDRGCFFKSFKDYKLLKLELDVLRYKYPETIFKVYLERFERKLVNI